MLVKTKKSPQGISRYNTNITKRICFTWLSNRAYLDRDKAYSKEWIAGSPWIGESGWYLLGPIQLMKWSKK